MTTSMTIKKQARALVIGNYRGRCGVVDALQGPEFYVWEATAWIQGLKHILEMCPKPSQNSSFKAITYIRSVAEGGIWGQVQEAHSLISKPEMSSYLGRRGYLSDVEARPVWPLPHGFDCHDDRA